MSSRDEILTAVKKAAKFEPGKKADLCKLEDAVFQVVEASCSHESEEMVLQFIKEVEKVSGEVYIIHNVKEAASIIQNIMTAEKYCQIAVTPETFCIETAVELYKADASIEVVRALSIYADERKKCLEKIPICIVQASYAVCETGTLVFPYDDSKTSLPHFLSECVIAVVSSASLVPTQFHLFQSIPLEKTGNMVFVTGPSRTADIEKILVLGAHGPKRLVVLVNTY